jgi:hypothetical protein
VTPLGEGASDGLLNFATPLRGFAFLKKHLLYHGIGFAPNAYHAGAGGARSRAIRVRMSANSCAAPTASITLIGVTSDYVICRATALGAWCDIVSALDLSSPFAHTPVL